MISRFLISPCKLSPIFCQPAQGQFRFIPPWLATGELWRLDSKGLRLSADLYSNWLRLRPPEQPSR